MTSIRRRRPAACIFPAPFNIQVQHVDDLAQNYLRLHDFEFGLNKVGVIRNILRVSVEKCPIRINFDSRRRLILRRTQQQPQPNAAQRESGKQEREPKEFLRADFHLLVKSLTAGRRPPFNCS